MLLPWIQVGLTNATFLATGGSYKCYFSGYRCVLQMLLPWLQVGLTNATSLATGGSYKCYFLATSGYYKCYFPGYRWVLQMPLPWLQVRLTNATSLVTRAVPNIRYVFASGPNIRPNSYSVFSRIVAIAPNRNSDIMFLLMRRP